MKRSILASLSIVLLSTTTAIAAKAESWSWQIKPTVAGPTVFLKPSVAIQSGTFISAEKPTTGTAKIITENGQRYLVLDSAFSTSEQGPDLHVLLDTTEKPPQQYQNLNSYVNLGKLQKYQGTQRYPIPAAINLANYKSVVIWCRMANATFGYAPLGGAAMTSQR
jgi:hypothetical protein